MNIKSIVKEYLEQNGYDGLYQDDNCACQNSDIMPCDEPYPDCKAGYFQKLTSDQIADGYIFFIGAKKDEPETI